MSLCAPVLIVRLLFKQLTENSAHTHTQTHQHKNYYTIQTELCLLYESVVPSITLGCFNRNSVALYIPGGTVTTCTFPESRSSEAESSDARLSYINVDEYWLHKLSFARTQLPQVQSEIGLYIAGYVNYRFIAYRLVYLQGCCNKNIYLGSCRHLGLHNNAMHHFLNLQPA